MTQYFHVDYYYFGFITYEKLYLSGKLEIRVFIVATITYNN